jgi:hypothetical protein
MIYRRDRETRGECVRGGWESGSYSSQLRAISVAANQGKEGAPGNEEDRQETAVGEMASLYVVCGMCLVSNTRDDGEGGDTVTTRERWRDGEMERVERGNTLLGHERAKGE